MTLSLSVDLNESKGGTVFSTFDPDLPLLAAQAAIEVEMFRLGKSTRLSSVHNIASLTSISSGIKSSSNPNRSLVDPVGGSVFAKAFSSSLSSKPTTSLEQLEIASEEMARELGEIGPQSSSSSKQLTTIRDFCAALSRYSTVAQAFVSGESSQKPNRV